MERNPVAVTTGIADRAVAACSTVELLEEARRRTFTAREQTSGEEAREFSIALTHIEDAITRHNKGVYMQRGTFAISDAERA